MRTSMENLSGFERALYDEGCAFCMLHDIKMDCFDGLRIVQGDAIRKALGFREQDPSKYYYVHEVPHVIWCLDRGILIV